MATGSSQEKAANASGVVYYLGLLDPLNKSFHTRSTFNILFVVYLKFTFNWAPVFLFAKSSNSTANQSIEYRIKEENKPPTA